MCGIAGIYAYSKNALPVDEAELLRMREQMVARGPDGSGTWVSGDKRVGLAHRRLAIVDLSPAGAQPMYDPETGNWIVYNGEVYNHNELRTQLNADGIITHSQCDTEVILKLYAQKGESMLPMLRGMFGFAIWDATKKKILLARGPFGIKPLYYADDGKSIRFASQVKSLLAGGKVDTSPNPAGHAGFFLWGSVPDPHTLYKGVKAMPAGHFITVENGKVSEPIKYCTTDEVLAAVSKVSIQNKNQALLDIAQAIHESIGAHMLADVPVGVFLSAGLDSTMIASSAAKRGDLRTITLGFEEYDGSPYDEAVLAGEVAQQLGASHSLYRISAKEFAADRDALFAAMDQPSIDGINVWFVSKAAAAAGLKVALSGIGGDELFGSYPSFHQIPKLRNKLAGFKHTVWFNSLLRKGLTPFAGKMFPPKYAGLLEYGHSIEGAYLLRRALYMPWELAGVMDPDMAEAGLRELDTLHSLNESFETVKSDRIAISALELKWYMRNQLLRDADWAGMAHSLEIRVPFLDSNLLKQFREIPSLDAMTEKRTVARYVAPNLPAAVLNRPKTGFSVPTHQWLYPDAPVSVGNNREWAKLVYAQFAN
jgi:asparagine synthase (glutamine-hydrolysing)